MALPQGYKQLEYIESTGTQWIDTGYTPNQDTTFEAKANLVSGNNFDGIAYVDSATHNAYGFFCFNNQLGCYYNSLYNINSGYVGVDKTYKLDKNLLYIDDILTHTFNQTTFTSYGSLRLFAMRRATTNMGYAHTKLYYNKIWDNNTLVRNFVPAKRLSDNAVGMYDKANSGKNLFDEKQAFSNGFINASGVLTPDELLQTTNNYLPVEPNTTYTFSFNIGGSTSPISYFNISTWDTNQTFIDRVVREIANLGQNAFTFTTPANCYYLRFTTYINNQNSTQLEKGSTATTYEPYPFYTNSGTGTFIPGPEIEEGIETYQDIYVYQGSRLPEGYQEVEYIESSGTQYILTSIPLNTIGRVLVDGNFETTSSGAWFLDGLGDTGHNLYLGKSRSNMLAYGNGADNSTNISSIPYVATRNTFELDKINGLYKVNGVTEQTFTSVPTFSTLPFPLFCGYNDTSISYKQYAQKYNLKLWDLQNELICDFIPAKNSSNVLGMYDLCNSGKNLWDTALPYVSGYLKADGTVDTNVSKPYYCIDYIEIDPNTRYTYSTTLTSANNGDGIRICFYDENKNFVGERLGGETTTAQHYSYRITSPANAKYIRISQVATFTVAQLEKNSSETSYEHHPFYTNSGTGTFTAGPDKSTLVEVETYQDIYTSPNPEYRNLPSGYTQVKYLESTGTQYIDLQKQNTATSKFYLKTYITADLPTTGSIIGANAVSYENLIYYRSSSGPYSHYFGNYTATNLPSPTNQLFEITADYVAKTLTINSNTYTSTAQPVVKNLYLFGSIGHPSTTTIDIYSAQRVYNFEYWNNDVLALDLIPCYNSNNVAGMYDISKPLPTQDLEGDCTQATTPTPSNPVEVVGITDSGITLYGIGNYKDTFDKATGKITRKVGVKVLNGTENWTYDQTWSRFYTLLPNMPSQARTARTVPGFSTHYEWISDSRGVASVTAGQGYFADGGGTCAYFHDSHTSVDSWKTWLSQQYANGTPVIIYYPLATETYEYPNFYTNAGTGTFIVGEDVHAYEEIETYETYYVE